MRTDQHGGDLASYPGVQLDFSINLNPLGIPQFVKDAIVSSLDEVAGYPDPQCRALRQALAEEHGLGADRIVCGNGASDLIYRICDALRPSKVLLPTPTFSEYERSAVLCEAEVIQHSIEIPGCYDLTEGFLNQLVPGVDLVFLCQPNNPTGRLIERELLLSIVYKTAEIGALLVVDECFLPFTEAESLIDLTTECAHLIVLRALTKTHSLAGLRLGYAVFGDTALAGRIARQGQQWNVSSIAQAAGLAALHVPDWMENTREFVQTERAWLTDELRGLGLEVIDSDANFLLFRSPVDLHEPLLERGILIRSCANFPGLDDSYWRIGIKAHPDNLTLVANLKEVLRG